MIKTKTIETVEEFDENGKLVKKTTTETEETDDNPTRYTTTTTPDRSPWYYNPFLINSGTVSQDNK